jgi:hypothetical protein
MQRLNTINPSAPMSDLQLAQQSWLWCQADCDTANQVGYFRRTMELERQPDEATLHIGADARYWLYVNGTRVTYGPARYPIEQPYIDSVDLRPHLRRGANVIAVRVHGIGQVKRCSCFMPRRCALLACVEIRSEGRRVLLASDRQWRARRASAYAADTPRYSNHQGFLECFDARLEQSDWTSAEHDDTSWPVAVELGATASLPPWRNLRPRPIPMLTMQTRLPARVTESGLLVPASPAHWSQVTHLGEALASAKRLPGDRAIDLAWPMTLECRDPQRAEYVLLDFAENDDGFVTLELQGDPGTVVDLGYSECITGNRLETFKQRVNYADRLVLGGEAVTYHPAWSKTLQYLLIAVHGRAVIRRVWQDVSRYPLATAGRFACSDSTLERIWQVSLNTIRMTAQDVYMDTPRRERAGWLADLRPQALVTYSACGDASLLEHQIRLVMESQDHDGVHVDYRPDPRGWVISRWPSIDGARMPDFTAMVPLILHEFAQHTGNLAPLREHWPRLLTLAQHMIDWIGDDGLVRFPGYRHNTNDYLLIDWAPIDRRGSNSAMNMLMVGSLEAMSTLAAMLGESQQADLFNRRRAALAATIQRVLFDERRGIFANGWHEGRLLSRCGYQENLLAMLYNVATPAQCESIERMLLDGRSALPRLHVDPDIDYYPSIRDGKVLPWDDREPVPIGSPVFTFYAVWALMRAGRTAIALATLREQYGPSLCGGASTVWEEWHGGTSQSHGWSAGPTWLLGRYVLGVEQTLDSPGLTILPDLGDLSQACGRVATRQGVVQVECHRTSQGAVVEVALPPRARARVGVPCTAGAHRLLVNDAPAANAAVTTSAGGSYLSTMLSEGEWRLSAAR